MVMLKTTKYYRLGANRIIERDKLTAEKLINAGHAVLVKDNEIPNPNKEVEPKDNQKTGRQAKK